MSQQDGRPDSLPISSRLGKVLHQGSCDLQDATWPGLLGAFLRPVRDAVLLPSLGLAENVMPGLVSKVPLLDETAASLVGGTFGAAKLVYTVLPQPKMSEQATDVIQKDIEATMRNSLLNRGLDLADLGGIALSVVGFTVNTMLDVITAPGRKYKDWIQSIKTILAFLSYTGMDEELAGAFATPRLVDNIIIMATVQNEFKNARRKRAACPSRPITPAEQGDLMRDAGRFLQFSVAAYGVFQILASRTVDANARLVAPPPAPASSHHLIPFTSSLATLRDLVLRIMQQSRIRQFARYLEISEEDILYATGPGGDFTLVRHFVAVDHKTKTVVLAVRGTYSVSGVLIDAESGTVRFDDGHGMVVMAHRGIAQRAKVLLKNQETWCAVQKGLDMNPTYRLVFTGHSLGAAIASLLNIRYYSRGTSTKEFTCYEFGCPPVIGWKKKKGSAASSSSSLPAKDGLADEPALSNNSAIAHSVCFIYRDDVVPTLSTDSVRRLAATLRSVDRLTDAMSPWERFRVIRGCADPPEELVRVVREGSEDLRPEQGAERLEIPAKVILWMSDTDEDGSSSVDFYEASRVADLPVLLSSEMMNDHLPPRYEEGWF